MHKANLILIVIFMTALCGCGVTPIQSAFKGEQRQQPKPELPTPEVAAEINVEGIRALVPIEITVSENGAGLGVAPLTCSIRFCSNPEILGPAPFSWTGVDRKWGQEMEHFFVSEVQDFNKPNTFWLMADKKALFPLESNSTKVAVIPDDVFAVLTESRIICLNIEIKNISDKKQPRRLADQIVVLRLEENFIDELNLNHEVILPPAILTAGVNSENSVQARVLFRLTDFQDSSH